MPSASAAVRRRGTRMPWAPQSRAPDNWLVWVRMSEDGAWWLTLYHPGLHVWDSDDGGDAAGCDCGDGFVHCSICGVLENED